MPIELGSGPAPEVGPASPVKRDANYVFYELTRSICPNCRRVIDAKILLRDDKVYMSKRCPDCGPFEALVYGDAQAYTNFSKFNKPGTIPLAFGTEIKDGCPHDCGLCPDHQQHACLGIIEVNSACNMDCPLCFADAKPGFSLTLEEVEAMLDDYVRTEGNPEVIQFSGGEPTIHPDFLRVLEYAVARPIDIVMINTNGIRFAHDERMLDAVAAHGPRVEVYLQFDGFEDRSAEVLRGERLVETKLKAVEALGRRGIKTSLVCTLHPGVNDHEVGKIVGFGVERPWITGISFQPATYSGRHVLPEELEQRITFPDVIKAIAQQTGGVFREDDFMPLPCAHPNCHSLTYAFRNDGKVTPLMRFIDARKHLDILANGILFSRNAARKLIEKYLDRVGGCGIGCFPEGNGDGSHSDDPTEAAASEFFARAVAEQLSQADVFRITITSFLDAYNFDVRRLMKCCIHHVLPSGHVIPFCAYNVLYREGHAALPALRDAGVVGEPATIHLGN